MSTLARAVEIVEKLEAAGIRATTDPAALALPGVLVSPPVCRYDLGCGFTAAWRLLAIAPAPSGPDRGSWAHLDTLRDTVAGVFPVTNADPVLYAPQGGTNTLPAYELRWEEAL